MTTDIASLGLDIDTKRLKAAVRDIDAFQRKMGEVETAATKVERGFAQMGKAAAGLGLGLAAAFSVHKILEYGDAWARATNQLRLATDGVEELRAAQEGVFAVSQKTFASVEATSLLTSKIKQYAGELTGGLEGTLALVETINKASAVSGTSAASQAAGLFQLNQALASGVLRGEELNSVMEQTPVIARAIADGLGLTIGQMRKVAAEGKITSELVVKAMQDQADEIEAAFLAIEPTVSMSLTKLQGSLTRLIGEAGAPIFEGLSAGISSLADALASSGALDATTAAVQSMVDAFRMLGQVIPPVAVALGTMLIAKQLAPAFVAMEFAMSGAAGRALVLERASQLMTTGLASARASVTGLMTALGGPLSVALGLAAGAFVLFANKAEEESKRALTSVADAINEARALYAQLDDENAEVRAQARATLTQKMQDAANDYADAIEEMFAMEKRLEELQGSDNAEYLTGRINQMTAALKAQTAEVETLRAKWAGLREEENSRIKPEENPQAKVVDPYGLLNKDTSAKELKEAAAQWAAFAKGVEDAIARVREAQSDRADMLLEMADAMAIVDEATRTGATAEELEGQLDILQDTNQLLNGPMAEAYQALGTKAQEVARQDALALQTARNRIQAARELLRINTDVSRLPRMAAALAVSPEEYELLRATFDLMASLPGLTEEQARAEAGKLRTIERVTEELDKQARRARDLIEAPARNWIDGLVSMSDDFWTDWVDKGWAAFDDLGDAFGDLWKRLASDLMRYAFEPIRASIMNAMGFGGMPMMGMPMMMPGAGGFQTSAQGAANGAGAGAGGGDFLSSLFNFGSMGAGGGAGGGFNLGSLGSLGQMAVASQGNLGLGSLGFMNGGNWMGAGIGDMLSGMLGKEMAKGISGMVGDIFNPANAMGGMFGSGLASLLGMNGKNAGIGGTIGGLAGSFFGPIGSAVGSFLGQALGSIIGPKESDYGAVAALDGQGRVVGMTGGKRTSETEGAARSAADAIAQGQDLLKKMGADLTATVDQLIFGTRDPSRFSLTGSAAVISSGTTGDPKALVNAALRAVLDGANFASPALQGVADAMLGAGRSFEDTIEVLGKLSDILPDTTEPLSQWGEALKSLNETFEDLRKSTQGAASATLDAAEAQAKGALRDDFNEAISDALMQAREPLKKQFGELLDTQMERVADAAALGGNLADVLALNTEELKDFIESAATNADVFSDLNEQFAELRAEAAALGSDVAALDEAFAKARQSIVDSFDDDISSELDRLSNPTLATLKQMLDGQKARLDQAKALGANIAAVERLNAIEQQRFFEGLSDDQFAALGDYLGIIEDFSGRIGVTLLRLRDELDDEISSFDERRATLERQESTWRSAAEALLELRGDLMDRYSDLSPQQSLDELRQRFGRLTEDARGGNESAIAALPQVAQQLIDRSRELFGSTRDFRNDFEGVTRVLDEIGNLGIGKADGLLSQMETLEQQRDLLIEIRDLISMANPEPEALAEALGLLGEGTDEVATLLRQYLELNTQAGAARLPNGQIASAALTAAHAAISGAPTAPAPGTYAPLPTGGAVLERSTGAAVAPPTATQTGSTSDSQTAEAIGELIFIVRQQTVQQRRDATDTRNELRRLAEVQSLTA